jgi:hypothetical protein
MRTGYSLKRSIADVSRLALSRHTASPAFSGVHLACSARTNREYGVSIAHRNDQSADARARLA